MMSSESGIILLMSMFIQIYHFKSIKAHCTDKINSIAFGPNQCPADAMAFDPNQWPSAAMASPQCPSDMTERYVAILIKIYQNSEWTEQSFARHRLIHAAFVLLNWTQCIELIRPKSASRTSPPACGSRASWTKRSVLNNCQIESLPNNHYPLTIYLKSMP